MNIKKEQWPFVALIVALVLFAFGQINTQGGAVVPSTPLPTSTTNAPPSITPSITATAVVPSTTATTAPPVGNRVKNGGFEGQYNCYDDLNSQTDNICTANEWRAFYNMPSYMPGTALAHNPVAGEQRTNVVMLPEFKQATLSMQGPDYVGQRVHQGQYSQMWYVTGGEYSAGVWQNIQTLPGEECTVTAYVLTHSGATNSAASETVTNDERNNSEWFITVNLVGRTESGSMFLDENITQRFGYWAGHYDRWAEIRLNFRANAYNTTVGIGNTRYWPLLHNDSFLDTVTVYCNQPSSSFMTPTQISSGLPLVNFLTGDK